MKRLAEHQQHSLLTSFSPFLPLFSPSYLLSHLSLSLHALSQPVYYVQETPLVLRVFVCESLSRGRKLTQLAPHHLVGHLKLDVLLPVMDLELQPDKLRKNRATAGIGADRRAGFHGIGKRQRNNMRPFPCGPAFE